jgi:hypothetical protein
LISSAQRLCPGDPVYATLAELPELAREIGRGTLDVGARPTPLADVEQVWVDAARTLQRIVLIPHERGMEHA